MAGLGQEGVGENCLKYLKRGWNRKKGRGNKDFKKGGQAGTRAGYLKKGVTGTPLRTMTKFKEINQLLFLLYNALFENYFNYRSRGRKFNVSKCDHFICLVLKTETSTKYMQQFCNFNSLIKEPKCFENIDYQVYLYLILTNQPKCFQDSTAFKTLLFHFRRQAFTGLKLCFQKQEHGYQI